MTLKELKQANGDLILEPVPWDETDGLANGAVLFYASLTNGTKPPDDRKVLWAGQVMTAGKHAGGDLLFVRLTGHGNAVLDSTDEQAAAAGRTALFRTRPFSRNDPRNLEPWGRWG